MKRLVVVAALAGTSLAQAQGQSQAEHVPPDPPASHVDHDMSYGEMAEMMGMDDRRLFGKVMLDRLEWQDGDPARQAWDVAAWYGGDFHKVWLLAEGERASGETHESRVELGWERIVSAWWSVRAGWRHDAGEGPARDWIGAGFAGLAPGYIETEATVYLGEDGRSALRFKAKRDVLFTQRLVLQPQFELEAFGKDDPQKLIGSGLASAKFGLRLRYEILREFAPYLGIAWSWRFGDSADLAEAAGEDSTEFSALAGLRIWF